MKQKKIIIQEANRINKIPKTLVLGLHSCFFYTRNGRDLQKSVSCFCDEHRTFTGYIMSDVFYSYSVVTQLNFLSKESK